MEQENSSTSSGAIFGFGFNDKNFSDRVLHIEIIADGKDEYRSTGAGDTPQCSASTTLNRRKRRRLDSTDAVLVVGRPEDAEESAEGPESFPVEEDETVPTLKKVKMEEIDEEDCFTVAGKVKAEPVESDGNGADHLKGDQVVQSDVRASNYHEDVPGRRRTVYISSLMLAAKSPFFYKLFSNGMKESDQREATLQIPASEEGPLMIVLQFMYSGKISANEPQSVLDVLMVADKFEVVSCIRQCARRLSKMPMTVELALLYLDLPNSVQADAVKQLHKAAKSFLANHFKDLVKCGEEVMGLPLHGVEAILSSDLLHVPTEDTVFDFVLRWAKEKYSSVEERRKVLADSLVPLIRYPLLSYRRLLRALTCADLQAEVPRALVLEALHFKTDGQRGKMPLSPSLEDPESKQRRFRERAYKQRPVKYIVLDAPLKQCIAYLDLRIEELRALYPQGKLTSQPFCAGGHEFYLSAHCNVPEQGAEEAFGLFLGMFDKPAAGPDGAAPAGVTVDYEFAVRLKNATSPVQYPFVVRSKSSYTFTGGKVVGYRNVLSTTWKAFTDDSSPYFHTGVLHLRAELTIRSG